MVVGLAGLAVQGIDGADEAFEGVVFVVDRGVAAVFGLQAGHGVGVGPTGPCRRHRSQPHGPGPKIIVYTVPGIPPLFPCGKSQLI